MGPYFLSHVAAPSLSLIPQVIILEPDRAVFSVIVLISRLRPRKP